MELYVDIKFLNNSGDGSKEKPFGTISEAAAIAQPGDTVHVAPGVYREYVSPANGGTEDARITYVSDEPLGATITGAERITNWEQYQGDVWVARVSNSLFDPAYNPYSTYVYGDWYFAKRSKHVGCVYINDRRLYEAASVEEVIEAKPWPHSWVPEEAMYKWYAEVEGDVTTIYANFSGLNPNEEMAEINARRMCFFPAQTGRNYITVRGFKICKAATNWAPPAAWQEGMIGPHWSKGWIIEDNEVYFAKCSGIGLGKYLDPENNHYFTFHKLKSPTQMERDAVCRGQYHGWLKENIGSHIVRRNNIHHCEQGGIIGRMGAVFSTIEDNHIHHINNMMELGGAEVAGIKLHAAIDVIMQRNHIHHCTMGIWTDWEAQGTRITRNLLHDNQRPEFATPLDGAMGSEDIFVEVGHGPTLIDNNILLSDVSVRIATQGVAMVHNLICGAFTSVGAGTDWRYTPYHMPHRTEVMGFMTILHGDDRFYNNIFFQRQTKASLVSRFPSGRIEEEERVVGTHVWDHYPIYEDWIKQFDLESETPDMMKIARAHFDKLPVWIDGNAYLGGALHFCKEENYLFDDKSSVYVNVREEDGRVYLDTNLASVIGSFTASLITTDVLGKAFEPQQRFEDRDGNDIIFDTDYFGAKRSAIIPGPFAGLDVNDINVVL